MAGPSTVWKGYVSFGLVTFPVRLFSAARPEAVHFHMLHKKDLSRVKEVWYCAEEDKPIERSEIVKGYATRDDEYVVVDKKELDAVAPPTATTMDIVQFVESAEVDPIFFESSYYMAPEKDMSKPYMLFLAALVESKRFAIAKVTMHQREHVVLLRPSGNGLAVHTLYYVDELHAANRYAAPAKVKAPAKELEMAKTLMDHLTAPFRPQQFHDTYRENLLHLIEQKQKGKKVTPIRAPRKAPVVDLMEALKKSLEAAAPAGDRKITRKSSRGRRKAA